MFSFAVLVVAAAARVGVRCKITGEEVEEKMAVGYLLSKQGLQKSCICKSASKRSKVNRLFGLSFKIVLHTRGRTKK